MAEGEPARRPRRLRRDPLGELLGGLFEGVDLSSLGWGLPQAKLTRYLGSVAEVTGGVRPPQTGEEAVLRAKVAAVLRVPLVGAQPLFAMTPTPPVGPWGLLWCVGFGLLAGLEASAITWLLYWLEDLYARIPYTGLITRPLIGALLVGMIALAGPEVLGVGYDLIRAILNGGVTVPELWRILAFKGSGWLLALSSGTVGGVLAPLFMIAGASGALLGHLLAPWIHLAPGLVALVFMAAVFGAAARAALTSVLFAVEVTGDAHAAVAVLVAVAVAAVVADRLLPYNLMTGKLVRRGLHVFQDYFAPPARQTGAWPPAGGTREP